MKFETNKIDEIVDGDLELKNELISLYLETLERVVNELEASFGKENHQKLWHDSVHELKGSSLNLGFDEMAQYCKKYEFFEGDINEKKEFIATLIKNFDSIKDSLK
jgi:HPt (histidine-containing phosphotransfer) domain-containing protein